MTKLLYDETPKKPKSTPQCSKKEKKSPLIKTKNSTEIQIQELI